MATDRTERLLNLVICLLGAGRPVSRAALRVGLPGYGEAASDEAFERMSGYGRSLCVGRRRVDLVRGPFTRTGDFGKLAADLAALKQVGQLMRMGGQPRRADGLVELVAPDRPAQPGEPPREENTT